MPRAAGRHQQQLQEARKDSLLETSEAVWPCGHSDLGLPGSRTVGELIFTAFSHTAAWDASTKGLSILFNNMKVTAKRIFKKGGKVKAAASGERA